jgi:outer membrane lipoprotein-sorting protein
MKQAPPSSKATPKPATPKVAPVKPAAPLLAPPIWESIATTKIQDLAVSLVVSSKETNFTELGKIGGSFATTYRVPRYNISYQFPNKMRVEAKVLLLSPLIIFNGDKKYTKIGPKTDKEEVKGQIGKKQSLMDMGIFAKDWLLTDYEPIFIRREGELLVYNLKQRFNTNRSHEIVWVNPKTTITERRQSFNGDNKFQKEIRYTNPKLFGNVWVPTRVEIYNQFGKLGAVQNVERVLVNSGLADSLFVIPA